MLSENSHSESIPSELITGMTKFHWHLEDIGVRHAYIKPRTPRLNGKVERSHGTDQREFYQLLTYTDDVDLHAKLAEWEASYNYHRPHGGL